MELQKLEKMGEDALGVNKTYASAKSTILKSGGQNLTEFTQSFDYVMVFPMEEITDPDGSFHRVQTKVAKHCMHAMLTAGLEIYPYLSVQDDELLVLIRAPLPVLEKFADEVDYTIKYDPAELNRVLEAGDAEAQISPIHINHDPSITHIGPFEHIFMKYDQDFDPKLFYTEPGENSPFHKSVRLKLIYALLRAPKRQGGCDLELSKLILKKKILCLYPLHDREIADKLLEKCTTMKSFPWDIPTHDMKEYFGEKIALYNVFIGHYSYWLILPAIIGLAFQLVVWATLNFSHPVLPFFSLVITVWSIVMLEYWKRREATTAMYWGMMDYEKTELDRPEFKGELIKSYINGKDMLYFPEGKAQQRIAISQTIITTFICIVIGVVAGIYVLRFSLQARNSTENYASVVASVLNTVQITIFNMIYQEIALKLTDRENHRTDTLYEDAMIVKLFVFQFINSYASFFFLAFIAGNLKRPDSAPTDWLGQCGATNCMEPLSINVAIIFGTRLTLTNFLDIFIPYLNHKMKLRKETKGIAEDKQLTPAEKDYMLLEYAPLVQSISVYADTAVQYGFSLLFITALPCACACSLISNYFKIKFQAWKLFSFYQRPVPAGAQDIGTWQTIFSIISVAAVITNAGLICFTMDVLWRYSLQGRVWIFIGFQWTLIGMQFLAQAIIPDVPREVEIQQQRIEFMNEKVVEKVADEDFGHEDETEETEENDDEGEGSAKVVKGCCASLRGKKKTRGKKIKECTEVTVFPYPFTGAWPMPLSGASGISTEEIKAAISSGSTGNTDGRSLGAAGAGGYSALPKQDQHSAAAPTYY